MSTSPLLLLTSFGPFPGVPLNPTPELAEQLAALAHAHGLESQLVCLPTTFDEAFDRLEPHLDAGLATGRLRAIVSLGVSGRIAIPQLERTAWNSREADMPDAAGRCVEQDQTCLRSDAPASLTSTLPIDSALGLARGRRLALGVSDDPGRYLCNELFFKVMWWCRQVGFEGHAGFVHVPFPHTPADLTTMSRTLEALIEAILTERPVLA